MGRRAIVGMTMGGLAVTLLMPAEAQAQQDRASATEKGSLVIFSKVEIRWDAAGFLLQDTFLSLTNDNNQDVRVQMQFVNGDAPLAADGAERAHPGWNGLDNELLLTANQPIYWSALTGQPAGLSPFTVLDPGFPPGRPAMDGTNDRVLRGFIYAWAVNRENEEIHWNHLKGEGTLINYQRGFAWEYNTVNHAHVVGAEGDNTGDPGVLNLDGTEYSRSWAKALMNFQAAGSAAFSGPRLVTSDTDITIHPVSVDFRQETDGPITTKASWTVWNENELKLSGLDRCVTCWDQTLASFYGIPNHFLLQNLQTDHGKACVDGLASQLCDFDFDQGDNLPLGADPRDIVSEAAAIIGVSARMLEFDGGADEAAAGANMVAIGLENAIIRYDVLGGPPPAKSDFPRAGTPMDVLNWLEDKMGISTDR